MTGFARNFLNTCIYSLATALAIPLAAATEKDALELEQRYREWSSDYVVNPDYTVQSVKRVVVQALTENAAREIKEYEFSYSTSIEKVDVLEAYTLKSDGRKIDVPKDNYQVNINRGKGDGGPVFSDRTRVTVVFPEMESGDSLVIALKRTESEPMFPGEFSIAEYYYDQTAYDDVRVKIRMPAEMKPQMQFRGMEKKVETKGGQTDIALSYSNPDPQKSNREDFSIFEWESQDGFAISSFDSYETIANAYGVRALPKALPTERVRQLAGEISGDEKDARMVARLLYDWVARNISYAGNCIGVGAVVPHDLDFILDNRMGDCKDHATLLQALYDSAGIESTQALVNSGSSYTLPTIPMVSSVNHVINYLPGFDQYVDSTNPDMPFDSLAFSVSDKPVLLVENFKEGARTPPSRVDADRQTSTTSIAIAEDGSASGKISVELAGLPAIEARALWRMLNQQQEEEWLNGQFSSPSAKGSAVISRDDPQPLSSQYSYSIEFQTPALLPSEGAGGMYVFTPGFSPRPVISVIAAMPEEDFTHEVACGNGYSIEELHYSFPDNLKILAVPENLSLQENHLEYRADYALAGNTLAVKRELRDKTPGNVCSAEFMNLQRATLKKIEKNLRSQVVYQFQS